MTAPTQTEPAATLVLRTAAVWGTYVLASRDLVRGQPLRIGDAPDALIAKPDASPIAELPIRAVGNGWELDPRGVSGGVLCLRGRREDAATLARAGAAIPILAGDYGVLQYGTLSLFFQYAEPSQAPRRELRVDLPLVLAFLFAVITFGGALLVLYLLFPALELPKPIELTSAEELKVRFHHREPPPPAPGAEGGGEEGAKGAKDSRPKTKPPRAMAKRAPSPKPPSPSAAESHDAPKGLSAMTDVVASEVGKEIHDTLGTISSVAQALGGLESASVVLGGQAGLGLHSGAEGGQGEGVSFGSGTLDTGFGSGAGVGGRGRGAGGSGKGLGRGSGQGNGQGGPGSGLGGERGLSNAEAARPGQGLSSAQISRIVLSRTSAYRACYETAAARDPSLRGDMTISFAVAPDGSVNSANVTKSTLANPRVEGCVLRQFSRLKFPKADKATNANWPLLFSPGGK